MLQNIRIVAHNHLDFASINTIDYRTIGFSHYRPNAKTAVYFRLLQTSSNAITRTSVQQPTTIVVDGNAIFAKYHIA